MPDTLLAAVLDRIDVANAADPNFECHDEREQPSALLYGQRMSAELASLVAAPSEALQIAVRGQHVERWMRPRADYPTGRAGYLAWRRDAGRYHADRVVEMMRLEGYDGAACERVARLIRKEGIKSNFEAQALEDTACLVFMRWYVGSFAAKHAPEDVLAIVAKSARKMSSEGRRLALTLPLSEPVKAVLAAAG